MVKVQRLLPLLIPLTALRCVYPSLKMGTGTGGTSAATTLGNGGGGGAIVPAGLGGSSGGETAPATGGAASTGGMPGSGGLPGVAGAASTGGVLWPAGLGGTSSTGGMQSLGGASSVGGSRNTVDARARDAPGRGGIAGSGGIIGDGGLAGSGGVVGTGGVITTGGAPGTGGATTSSPCAGTTPGSFGQPCGSCGGKVLCDSTCSVATPATYGQSCGSCGGKVLCDGTCSVATPATYGQSCGSCGGRVICDGTCSVATPATYGQACGTCGGAVLCASVCSCDPGLVGWYKFQGNANDSSPYANHGSVTNAVLTTDRNGGSNGAYLFNGSETDPARVERISVPDSSSTNLETFQASGYSVAAWIYPTDTSSGYKVIASKGKDVFGLRLEGTTVASWHQDAVGATYLGSHVRCTVGLNTWSQVAATWNSSTNKCQIYVNGSVCFTMIVTGLTSDGVNPISIGADDWYDRWYFKGKIDSVRIYKRELTATEVGALYLLSE